MRRGQHRRRRRLLRPARLPGPRHLHLRPRRGGGRARLGLRRRHLPLPGGPRHLRPRRLVRPRRPRPRHPPPPHPAPGRGGAPQRGDRRDLRRASGWRRGSADDRRPGAHAHHHPGRGAQLPGVPGPRRGRRARSSGSSSRGSPTARPAAGRARGDRRGRADRDRPLEPGGLDRDHPGGARGARRAARPGAADCVAVSPDHRRRARSRARPTASWRAPATRSARPPRWRASTPTWPPPSCSTTRDEAEAPAIAALGVRPVLTDALMPDRPARARLAADGARGARVSAAAHRGGGAGEARCGWPCGGWRRCSAPASRRELQVAMLTDVLGACAGRARARRGPGGDRRPRSAAARAAARGARSSPTTTRRGG